MSFSVVVRFDPDQSIGLNVKQYLEERIKIFQLQQAVALDYVFEKIDTCQVTIQDRTYSIKQAGEIVKIFTNEILSSIQNHSLARVS
jgi:hypothetical protein